MPADDLQFAFADLQSQLQVGKRQLTICNSFCRPAIPITDRQTPADDLQFAFADLQSRLQIGKRQLTICNSLLPTCNPDCRSANVS